MSIKHLKETVKMKTKYSYFILTGALLVVNAFGGTIKSNGTSGATQLSVPVGAHGIALNGSNLATVSGVEALYFNPAGASNIGGTEAMFSNMSYIADIKVNYAGFVSRLGNSGTLGLSVKSFNFGDIGRTTSDNTEGTGETFSPNFMTLSATWSKSLADRMRFGVNMKYVQEEILRTSASGLGFDMGIQYSFSGLPMQIGVVLSNLGNKMQYSGSDLEQKLPPDESGEGTNDEPFQIVSEPFEMPVEMNIGLSYEAIPGLLIQGTFNNNSSSNNELRFGSEYSMSFGDASVWIGTGLSIANIDDEKPDNVSQADWSESTESNFGTTFGAGIVYPIGELTVGFEVAQRTVVDYFDNNLVYALKISF